MKRSRDAQCSFCRKSYREVGPLVEGPEKVYICAECVELTQTIIEQEKRRRSGKDGPGQIEPIVRRVEEMVADVFYDENPELMQLLNEGNNPDPALISSMMQLSRATSLVAIISGLIQKLNQMGLNSAELHSLLEIDRKVSELRAMLADPANSQGPA